MIDLIKEAVLPGLLKYAIQRKIFCECGRVLDIADAVLVEVNDVPKSCSCGDCFDTAVQALDNDTAKIAIDTFAVLDGRLGARSYLTLSSYLAPAPAPAPAIDQLTLNFELGA